MFDNDIQQLRAILSHVVTLGADTPQTRPYLNHAYAGLMEALTALEQLQVATSQDSCETDVLKDDAAASEASDRAFLAYLTSWTTASCPAIAQR